jgi:CTP synthase
MENQKGVSRKGGTMRLGSYPCSLAKGTMAQKAYGATDISERHRHRYELNNLYRDILVAKGLVLSGVNKDLDLVEMVEIKDHPWFVGCQFHPEFKSKPLSPHPLFKAFVAAAMANRKVRS